MAFRVTPQSELALSVPEVARMLGISRALAYRWVDIGLLPAVRIPGSRTLRVLRVDLDQWLADAKERH